jgi:hypothetical protein
MDGKQALVLFDTILPRKARINPDKSLCENLGCSWYWIITKVRAEGRGGRATNRLKEAGVQTLRRLTETV